MERAAAAAKEAEDGRATAVAAAAVLLALLPFALGWASSGIASAFRHFAADAFYYLTIAKHPPPFALFAFDGEHPTNGFHPLWQVFLRAALPGLDQTQQIALAHWSGVFCVAVAAGLLARAATRMTGRPALALLAAVPGLLYPAVALVDPAFGALWSFANGMESGVSLLLFGVLLTALLRPDAFEAPGSLLALSTLATLMVLARLDDVFLLAGLAAPVLLARRDMARRLALLWTLPALVLAGYLAVNLAYAGAALPVSGTLKSGVALMGNLRSVATLLLPLDPILAGDWSGWRIAGGRTALIVLPAAVSLAFAAWASRPGRARGPAETALLGLAVYVILKALYALAFMRLAHQGYWYFPVSIMVASLQLAVMAAAWAGGRAGARAGASLLAAALVAVLAANAFTAAKETGGESEREFAFWTRRETVTRDLAAIDPAMKILSYDDGIVGFALGLPVMSGFGFALDVPAARAKREGRLLDLAHARGFRHIASVNNFPDFLGLAPGTDVTDRLVAGGWIGAEAGRRWRATLVHADAAAHFKLMRLDPAP